MGPHGWAGRQDVWVNKRVVRGRGPAKSVAGKMVWNITKDDIRVRMAVVDEDVWPPQPSEQPQVPDPTLQVGFSDFIVDGKYDMKEVIQPIYDDINKRYGLDEKQE